MTSQIIMAGQVAGALSAIAGVIFITVKYAIVKPIQAYIDNATYQIQPHANGGRSLADVAKIVGELKGELCQISARLEALEASGSTKRKKG